MQRRGVPDISPTDDNLERSAGFYGFKVGRETEPRSGLGKQSSHIIGMLRLGGMPSIDQLAVEKHSRGDSRRSSDHERDERPIFARLASGLVVLLLFLLCLKLIRYSVNVGYHSPSVGVLYFIAAFAIAAIATLLLLFFALDLPALHPLF
jgi:hypothetical protein